MHVMRKFFPIANAKALRGLSQNFGRDFLWNYWQKRKKAIL